MNDILAVGSSIFSIFIKIEKEEYHPPMPDRGFKRRSLLQLNHGKCWEHFPRPEILGSGVDRACINLYIIRQQALIFQLLPACLRDSTML